MLFILPIAMVTGSVTSELKKQVTFLEQEQNGVAFLLPLKNLLSGVARHRGLTNTIKNGKKEFRSNQVEVRLDVDVF